MFKFARYFFVVFIITTIIPLTLMVFLHHKQMEKMMKERHQVFHQKPSPNHTKDFPGFHPPGPPPGHPPGRPPGLPILPDLIILLGGSVLSLYIGHYLNKNFIKPLLVLSNAIKHVQKGNLNFQLSSGFNQEQIKDIFNNFNLMITGLKEKDLLRKNFITSLTHDLKTPLIAQERSLGLISREFEALDMQKAYELAKGVEKNNKHLLRMVDLILESYRFEFGNLNIVLSEINLSKLVDTCYQKLYSLAAEKNIQLINNIPNDFPAINADITNFKRIFLNLISNSIDSITQDGKIEISAEVCEKFIKIFIKDNGVGIAQEELTHIFDRYYTGKSHERKLGSGLGLYVCKKLIELHEGELTVNSEINKYTEFTIKLPQRRKDNELKNTDS